MEQMLQTAHNPWSFFSSLNDARKNECNIEQNILVECKNEREKVRK